MQRVNQFSVVGDTAILYCPYKGSLAAVFIDAADLFETIPFAYWRVADFRSRGTHQLYCYTRIGRKTVYMHRWLVKPPVGMVVDHRDHRGTNNRHSNLRVCTESLNQLNRRKEQRGSRSGVRGVVWDSRCGKWIATVGEREFGRFTDPQACRARVEEVLREKGITQ